MLSSALGRQVVCVNRSNHQTRRPSSTLSANIPPLHGGPSFVSIEPTTRPLTTAGVDSISLRSWCTVQSVHPVPASNSQISEPLVASRQYIVSPPGTTTRGWPLSQVIVGEPA